MTSPARTKRFRWHNAHPPSSLTLGAVLFIFIQAPSYASPFGKLPPMFEPHGGHSDVNGTYIWRGTASQSYLPPADATRQLTTLEGVEPADVDSNSSLGEDSVRWVREAQFRQARCRSVSPNVDALFHGNERDPEYDLPAPRNFGGISDAFTLYTIGGKYAN
jgi:hypothetical protein